MNIDGIRQRCLEHFPKDMPLRGIPGAVNSVMELIRGKGDWSFWRTSTTIALLDVYETGTVAITKGETTVTGTDTVWVTGMIGRKIRIGGTEEYTITAVGSGTGLTLDHAYAGETETAAAYEIYQNLYSLPSDCETVLKIWDLTNKTEIRAVSPSSAQGAAVYTDGTQTKTGRYAITGIDTSGNARLLFYPAPNEAATILVWYFKRPTAVSRFDPTATPDCPATLHETVLQGVFWHLAQRAGHPLWENERGLFYQMLNDRWRRDKMARDFKVRMCKGNTTVVSLHGKLYSLEDLNEHLLTEDGAYLLNELVGHLILE